MGSDGSSPHLWPGSALYGVYSGLSGEGGPKAQVRQRLLSGLRQKGAQVLRAEWSSWRNLSYEWVTAAWICLQANGQSATG
jgi:hypothetical protein